MQIKLSSSIIQFAKVSVGDMKKPTEPTTKTEREDKYVMHFIVPAQESPALILTEEVA